MKQLDERVTANLKAIEMASDSAPTHLPLINFFLDQEQVTHAELAEWAVQNGLDPQEVENHVFRLFRSLIKGVGKHANVPDSEFDPEQLKMGIKVEQEHTDDPDVAKIIAKDHLMETGLRGSKYGELGYYTLLQDMENKAKETASLLGRRKR